MSFLSQQSYFRPYKLSQQQNMLIEQQTKKAQQAIKKIDYNLQVLFKKIPEQVLNMKGYEFKQHYQNDLSKLIYAFSDQNFKKSKEFSPSKNDEKKKIIKNGKKTKENQL